MTELPDLGITPEDASYYIKYSIVHFKRICNILQTAVILETTVLAEEMITYWTHSRRIYTVRISSLKNIRHSGIN